MRKYEVVQVTIDTEEREGNMSVRKEISMSIFAKYDSKEKINDCVTLVMKYLKKAGLFHRVVITLEGRNEEFDFQSIKRYTFNNISYKHVIEHRPYNEVSQSFSIVDTNSFDEVKDFYKAFKKELTTTVNDSISFIEN